MFLFLFSFLLHSRTFAHNLYSKKVKRKEQIKVTRLSNIGPRQGINMYEEVWFTCVRCAK